MVLRYFDAPYCFIGFFQKHGIAGALQHHVLYMFAGKIMAADANQLQDLGLRARDEDSA